MGYRGDDASRTWGDPRREEPWQGPSRDEYGNYVGDPYGAPPQHGGGYGSQDGYGSHDGYGGQGGYGSPNAPGGYSSQGGYGSQGGYQEGYDPQGGQQQPYQGGYEGYGDGYGQPGGYSGHDGYGGGHDGYGGQGGYGSPNAPGGYGQPAGGFPDNDWYGDSRSGGFADTSMHTRPAIPEGYRPGDYDAPPHGGGGFQQPPRNALPASPPVESGLPGQVSQTRHQPVLNDNPADPSYPGYENVEGPGGFGSGGYPSPQGYDDYDDYANFEMPAPTTSQPVYEEPAPTSAQFAYNDPAPTGADFAYNEPAPTSANPAAFDDPGDGFGNQTAVFTPGGFTPGGQEPDDYAGGSYGDDFDGESTGAHDPFPIPGDEGAAMGAGAAAAGLAGARGKGKKGKGKKGKASAVRSGAARAAARSAAAARTSTIARPGKGRKKGNRKLVIGGSAVVLVGALAAVYFFIINPSGQGTSADAPIPPPGSSKGGAPACAQQYGTFCHITNASDDPTPLTVSELYPPAVLNEKDHLNFIRIVSRTDKSCSGALLGSALKNAAKKGKCTQVVRASYTSGSGSSEIMGTIGVVNLSSDNQAHYAGRTVGTSDFVSPLASNSGVGADLGKSTGVMESQYKGHYLILTWAEMANEATPTSSDQKKLEQFENDLIASTANIALSQRMVNGKPGGGA